MELRPREDLYIGLVLVCLAGIGLLWLVPAQIVVSITGMYDLSPRLVPRLVLGLAVLLGLLVAWHGWAARRSADGEAGAAPPGPLDARGRPRNAAAELGTDVVVWIASSVAVMVGLTQVGFVLTAGPLLAVWLLFAGVRSWPLIVALALVLPITLERLCWYALTIRLP